MKEVEQYRNGQHCAASPNKSENRADKGATEKGKRDIGVRVHGVIVPANSFQKGESPRNRK